MAVDTFTEVINTLQLKSCLASRTEISPGWRFDFTTSSDAVFHIFNFGDGYIRVEGSPTPLKIADGDVVLLPYGNAHTICDSLTSPLVKTARIAYSDYQGYEVFSFEGQAAKTVLLCGIFHFEKPYNNPLMGLLPPVIHIKGTQNAVGGEDLADTIRLMAKESHTRRPGFEALLNKLSELLFIQIIRVWVETQPEDSRGWLFALRDPQIGRTLTLIHQHPARLWTLEELAASVAMSRSGFTARFTELVGESPIRYLTRWRMQTAQRLIQNGWGVSAVAEQFGYASEAAFRKAFKRELGEPPGKYRLAVARS